MTLPGAAVPLAEDATVAAVQEGVQAALDAMAGGIAAGVFNFSF